MPYNSQIGQDVWVDTTLHQKRGGYFVELGACDGIYFSNTLCVEKDRGWSGLCIEPNDMYFRQLKTQRTCTVSNALVSDTEGQTVTFCNSEAASGILDAHVGPFTRKNVTATKITSTLANELSKANAPHIIDYLSLDVEGHEYTILSTFPFDTYKFRCLTVEHNEPHVGPEMRNKIRAILEENGYRFVKGNDDVHRWGHGPIDDFYIHPDLV
jgi:FkbM family methyltransferase